MKKIVLVILMVLAISVGVADAGFFSAPGTQVQEEDGSPDVRALTLKVTNGSLTDNGDGTASITTSGGSSEWSDDGTTLTTTDAGRDVQIDGALTATTRLYTNVIDSTTNMQIVNDFWTNSRLGINTSTPQYDIDINTGSMRIISSGVEPLAVGLHVQGTETISGNLSVDTTTLVVDATNNGVGS